MPQFEFANWPGQIAWVLITFAVLYGVLSRVFIPRVQGAINGRRDKIAGDMAEARRLRDAAETQAELARAQINEAKARAQRTAADAKSAASAEAIARQNALEVQLHERLAAAEARIRASRTEAMAQVQGIAEEAAAAVAEKLTGVAANSSEITQASKSVALDRASA
jgi:F-type H+-transporting ATPase subunit b